MIFTDAETQLLPDKMTYPGLRLGSGFSLVVPVNDLASQLLARPGFSSGELGYFLRTCFRWWMRCSAQSSARPLFTAPGAIYLRLRGVEGMGFGDVKLMAMVGAFLGIKLTIFTLFTASIAGSMFGIVDGAGGLDQTHPPRADAQS